MGKHEQILKKKKMFLLTFGWLPVLDGLGNEGPVRCLKRAKALLRPSVLFLSGPRSNKIHPQNNSLNNLAYTENKNKKKKQCINQYRQKEKFINYDI